MAPLTVTRIVLSPVFAKTAPGTFCQFTRSGLSHDWCAASGCGVDKRMVTCFNTADGVTILPTHRVVRDLPEFRPDEFLRSIEEFFEVEPVSSAAAGVRAEFGDLRNRI